MATANVDVVDIEFERFKNNGTARQMLSEAVVKLRDSGFVAFLRTFARPFAINQGANPYQSAYMAAFVEGYNKALDDIMYFEELYCNDLSKFKKVKADFGALKLALDKGDLTKKDLENGR